MTEYLIGHVTTTLTIPALMYWVGLYSIFNNFDGFGYWTAYTLLFPFFISIFPFFLKRYTKKIKFFLLPLVIFIVLQIIPLPRSPFSASSYEYNKPSAIQESFAIGLGYPISYAKIFLADSKDVHFGQFMFVPEASIYNLVLLGFLLEGYFIFLIIAGLTLLDKPKKLHKTPDPKRHS